MGTSPDPVTASILDTPFIDRAVTRRTVRVAMGQRWFTLMAPVLELVTAAYWAVHALCRLQTLPANRAHKLQAKGRDEPRYKATGDDQDESPDSHQIPYVGYRERSDADDGSGQQGGGDEVAASIPFRARPESI